MLCTSDFLCSSSCLKPLLIPGKMTPWAVLSTWTDCCVARGSQWEVGGWICPSSLFCQHGASDRRKWPDLQCEHWLNVCISSAYLFYYKVLAIYFFAMSQVGSAAAGGKKDPFSNPKSLYWGLQNLLQGEPDKIAPSHLLVTVPRLIRCKQESINVNKLK